MAYPEKQAAPEVFNLMRLLRHGTHETAGSMLNARTPEPGAQVKDIHKASWEFVGIGENQKQSHKLPLQGFNHQIQVKVWRASGGRIARNRLVALIAYPSGWVRPGVWWFALRGSGIGQPEK